MHVHMFARKQWWQLAKSRCLVSGSFLVTESPQAMDIVCAAGTIPAGFFSSQFIVGLCSTVRVHPRASDWAVAWRGKINEKIISTLLSKVTEKQVALPSRWRNSTFMKRIKLLIRKSIWINIWLLWPNSNEENPNYIWFPLIECHKLETGVPGVNGKRRR